MKTLINCVSFVLEIVKQPNSFQDELNRELGRVLFVESDCLYDRRSRRFIYYFKFKQIKNKYSRYGLALLDL